jgi:hypothetical protein
MSASEGDRLGIYRALDGAGPVTAEALAARTGLHPRWLLEWLRGQAAAGLLDTADGQVFQITPETAVLLADEEGSVWCAGGAFHGAAAAEQTVDQLAESAGWTARHRAVALAGQGWSRPRSRSPPGSSRLRCITG